MAGTYYAGDAASFNTAITQANGDPGSTIVITADFNVINPTTSTQPLNINLNYQGTNHRLGISGLDAGTNSLSVDNTGTGFITLTGTNQFNGLNVRILTLSADGGSALGGGSITINSATFNALSNVTVTQDVNLGFTGASLTTANSNFSVGFEGIISGGGGATLYAAGGGTITLAGSNTYAGPTLVQTGILNVQNNTALGTTAAGTTVSTGTTLQLQNSINVGGEALSLSGNGFANNQGALENVSGNNSFGGTLTLAGATRINSDAGVLALNAPNAITGDYGLTLGGVGNGLISSIIATHANSLTKVGSGTWILSAANTYSGGTTLNSGKISLAQGANGQNSALGTGAVTLNAGTLELAANSSYLTNAISVSAGATATIGALSNTSGSLLDTLTLNSNSTLIIGNNSTDKGYVGNFTGFTANVDGTAKFEIGGGVLYDEYGGFGQITSQAALTTIDTGATIELAGNSDTFRSLGGAGRLTTSTASGTTTINGTATGGFSGSITGAQAVTFATGSGTGQSLLTGTNTYTGATTVQSGTLLVNGSITASATTVQNGGTLGGSGTTGSVTVQSGGRLSPGNSPGLLNTRDLTLASGSTYVEQIGGTTAGTDYDQTNVTGAVNLNGGNTGAGATLSVSFVNNFAPTAGQTYTIINNDSNDAVVGTFKDASGNSLAEGSSVTVNGVALVISYRGGDGNDVTLTDPASSSGSGGSSGPSTTPTPGPDILTGTSGADTIGALAGDDTVNGGGGNDLILGNQGNDSISDGDGNSTIAGGMDNDRITVGNGSNLLFGNEGSDTISAGNGGNTIVGGQDSTDGADLITSGAGNDLILGNGGDDTVAAGGGADTVVGGFGRDIILGNQGDDLLLGNQGDDTLYGGQGADTLVGGMGNDVLYGNEGDDVLYGNEGLNTFVFAPGDTDFKSGQSTGDTVMDFVTGTSRIDFASGPAGSATNFGAGSTTAQDFASAQAVAQGLINSGDAYAFVSNGTDGYLFTTGGSGTAITDAVKLAGAATAGAVKYTDIAHGALA